MQVRACGVWNVSPSFLSVNLWLIISGRWIDESCPLTGSTRFRTFCFKVEAVSKACSLLFCIGITRYFCWCLGQDHTPRSQRYGFHDARLSDPPAGCEMLVGRRVGRWNNTPPSAYIGWLLLSLTCVDKKLAFTDQLNAFVNFFLVCLIQIKKKKNTKVVAFNGRCHRYPLNVYLFLNTRQPALTNSLFSNCF